MPTASASTCSSSTSGTRAYLFRQGQLEQLTRDHTVAQALADAGDIKQQDVRKHQRRNTLTNYLGGHSGKVKADVRWLQLEDGDRVILCSDGLSDMVEDPDITACLRVHPEADAASLALTRRALENGGKDNVTVVVANYSIPEPSLSPPPASETAEYSDQRRIDSTTDFPRPEGL